MGMWMEHGRPACAANRRLACCDWSGKMPDRRTGETPVLRNKLRAGRKLM